MSQIDFESFIHESRTAQPVSRNVFAFTPSTNARTINRPTGSWVTPVTQKLDQLCNLTEGWDGYSGKVINYGTAHFTNIIISRVQKEAYPTPFIAPCSSGDLQIDWYFPNGDVEVVVSGPLKIEAWRFIGGDEDGEMALMTNDFTILSSWLDEMQSLGT